MTRACFFLSALALLFCGCTNDFSAFSFSARDGSIPVESGVAPQDGAVRGASPDGGAGAGSSNPPDAAGVDSGMDSGGADSSLEPDAGPAEDAATDSGQVADSGTVEAGADADTGQQDAAVIDQAVCRASLEPLVPDGRLSCEDCGCAACGTEVVSCLLSGDSAEDSLCEQVVGCALENSCQVWDCYCSAPNCGGSSPDGDGPCVAEMNAAADGQKAEVMLIWQSGDRTEPLVRALDAVSCLVGRHRKSPGGASAGACQADCL